MLDLTVYPLFLDSGQEQYEIPGLLVTTAPRKAARMRSQDQLLLMMRLLHTPAPGQSGPLLTPAQQQEMLHRLAETYFTVSGSVTAGLRAVTARLNDFLLNRNLKAAQSGQTLGLLNLAAIHNDSLYVSHGGATHTFVLGREQVQHFDDSAAARSPSGRGLGLSRQATPKFYQSAIMPGDLLLVCAEPPAAWTSRSLANSPQLSFDHLRRRLISDAGGDLQAVVVRVQTGKGQVVYWKPSTGAPARPGSVRPGASRPGQPAQTTPAAPGPAPAAPVVVNTPPVETKPVPQPVETPAALPVETPLTPPLQPSESVLEDMQGVSSPDVDGAVPIDPGLAYSAAIPEPPDAPPGVLIQTNREPAARDVPQPRPVVKDVSSSSGLPRIVPTDSPADTATRQGPPPRPGSRTGGASAPARKSAPARPAPKPRDDTFKRELAVWMRKAVAWRGQMTAPLAKMARSMPKRRDAEGREQPYFNLSASVMIAVAIIIPLLVTTAALVVYDQIGRADMFQTMLAQAQLNADAASQQTDPTMRRDSWAHVYDQVVSIERDYGQNEESNALRKQAQSVLDELEGNVRLNYQPVTGTGFSSNVNITRMVATFNDVYLLDGNQGRVFRLYRTGSGYELDTSFSCGPGQAGANMVGPIIDITALPPNNDMRSSVMGIDASGKLVYCSPNLTGFDSRILTLPDNGWGEITAIYYYSDTLFVLDPKGNGVYYYDGANGVFEQPPHMYFTGDIPDLASVIDLALDQEFLYLLHNDSRMTLCESGGYAYAETTCTEPAPYGDTRPGFDPAPLSFNGTKFTQMITTDPPDPSLYTLDEANRAIYHLSLRRLNFQRQYRPQTDTDFPLPLTPPTAFAVAPNRWTLLAFGNQVFFSPIP